ncbi:response regulator transcription factor [Piscinibacter sp. XHJ-5]|uniref:response regulator transcription factor n=1 Tax=Piscinibacter sp. XHJ-5 TaxID=3037797 RepID=UPI002452FF06|nr:response regulator transcription factor [Piscinibacter sp. XHJ-5]
MAALATTARWRVLLADDHAMVREGLAVLIGAQPDMEVVGHARSGREAVEMAEQLRPHVAVLDVSMPLGGGIEAAEKIHLACPEVRLLALTRHGDPGYLRRMIRAGAHGYVVKRAAGEALIGAIRTVADGGAYFDSALAGVLLASVTKLPGRARQERPQPSLSEREEQVLRLVAWGKSNKEIGAQLGISVKTVECYKAGALDKLRLRSRADIVRHALVEKWFNEDDDPE